MSANCVSTTSRPSALTSQPIVPPRWLKMPTLRRSGVNTAGAGGAAGCCAAARAADKVLAAAASAETWTNLRRFTLMAISLKAQYAGPKYRGLYGRTAAPVVRQARFPAELTFPNPEGLKQQAAGAYRGHRRAHHGVRRRGSSATLAPNGSLSRALAPGFSVRVFGRPTRSSPVQERTAL